MTDFMEFEFWIEGSRWFGMTMYPGYFDRPYHSPIKMMGFSLLDNNKFELDFLDPFYAQGVQEFSVEFEAVRSTADYQVCLRADQPDRAYVFVPLTPDWMKTYFPQLPVADLFDADGRPIERAIRSVGNSRY